VLHCCHSLINSTPSFLLCCFVIAFVGVADAIYFVMLLFLLLALVPFLGAGAIAFRCWYHHCCTAVGAIAFWCHHFLVLSLFGAIAFGAVTFWCHCFLVLLLFGAIAFWCHHFWCRCFLMLAPSLCHGCCCPIAIFLFLAVAMALV